MPKLTLSFKGKLLKTYPIGEGETVIGSDPGCPVSIDSLAIQPQHASIIIEEGKTILRDLGTPDGTFVNSARLSGDYTLKDGDDIRVGKHDLIFNAGPTILATEGTIMAQPMAADEPMADLAQPEHVAEEKEAADEAPRTPRHAFLQILNGQNLGKTISLNRNLVNLGKPGVQLAVIVHRNDGYFLSHLEGEAAPKVGDTTIGDKAWQLQDGDIITLGNVRMQFSLH